MPCTGHGPSYGTLPVHSGPPPTETETTALTIFNLVNSPISRRYCRYALRIRKSDVHKNQCKEPLTKLSK